MHKKKNYDFPDAIPYPGRFTKNNKKGTMLSRSEWMENEARRWVVGTKDTEEFENMPLGNRVLCMRFWLEKAFKTISKNELTPMLIRLESENVEDEEQTQDVEEDDEDGPTGEEQEPIEEEPYTQIENMEEDMDTEYDSSQDMFEGMEVVMENLPKSKKQIECDNEQSIKNFLEMKDDDLMNIEVPDFVLKDKRYLERQEKFVEQILNNQMENSQDILNQMSQLPKCVQDHKLLRNRLGHLSKAEKSTRRVTKNLKKTLRELRKDKSAKSFQIRVQLVASVIDHRYGAPDLGETKYVIAAAKKLNEEFWSGKKTTLEADGKKKRQIYPPTVEKIADESWYNRATTPDPAKHARPSAAMKDGDETIPTLYQVVTDDEAYEQFKDHDRERVRVEMQKVCEEIRNKYMQKDDSETKQKTMEILRRRENLFPSKTWFLARKPPQTKLMDDHSTALCRDCVSSDTNYETIYKFCKKFCKCGSRDCPSWVCNCEEEDPDHCECQHDCTCDDCSKCEVSKNSYYYEKYFILYIGLYLGRIYFQISRDIFGFILMEI